MSRTVQVTPFHVPSDWREARENIWYLGDTPVDALGFIPAWVDADDDCSMVDQIHNNYAHGGGWKSFSGFVVNPLSGVMSYPGDPAQHPIAMYQSKYEVLWMYDHGWITVYDIVNKTCRTARID